jgi:hypothetical protein
VLKNLQNCLAPALVSALLLTFLVNLPAKAESVWGGIDPHKEFLFFAILGVGMVVEWPIIARLGRFSWQKSLIAVMILNMISVIIAYVVFKDPMKSILGFWKYDGIHSLPMFPIFCTACVLLNTLIELPLLVVVFGWRFKPMGLAGILLANFISVYAATGMTTFLNTTVSPDAIADTGNVEGNKISGTNQWNPIVVNSDSRAVIDTKYDANDNWSIKITLTPLKEKFSEKTQNLINANLVKIGASSQAKTPTLKVLFKPQRMEVIQFTGFTPVTIDGSVTMYTSQSKVRHPENWLDEAVKIQLDLLP